MAHNEEFRFAKHMSLPVPEGTKAGDPVKIGALNGVAQTNVATDDDWAGGNPLGYASVWLSGSHRLHVVGAVDIGDPVYWADGALTPTAPGTEPPFGVALNAQAGSGVVAVMLVPASAPAAAVQATSPDTQAAKTRQAKS